MAPMKKPPSKTPSSSEASTTRRSKMRRKESSRSSKRTMNKSDSRVDDHQEKLKKGPWTTEEDELLVRHIKTQGEGGWRTLPKRAGLLRCGKSCRLRWMNYLRPNVKRGHITPDEEDLILRLHRLLGNRWSMIAGRIPGRTDNEIKNYWNTHLSKKLIRQGINPRTHKPFSLPHHLIPQNAIQFNHNNNSTNHKNVVVAPDNANPNSANAATTISQNTSTNSVAHHPTVSQTHALSSPTVQNNNNDENEDQSKDLIRDDDGKVIEEQCEHDKHSKATDNATTSTTATTTYQVTTTMKTTAVPVLKTIGLDKDSTSNMINQVMMCPNYSADTRACSLQQLLNRHFNDDYDDNMLLHDNGDDDQFSYFLNSLINDDTIFPCNSIDDGNQPLQQLSVLPAAPPTQGGGGGEDSHAVTMNIISTSSSLGFHMVGGQWDDTFES